MGKRSERADGRACRSVRMPMGALSSERGVGERGTDGGCTLQHAATCALTAARPHALTVTGAKSPYPTVDTVTMINHMARGKSTNVWLNATPAHSAFPGGWPVQVAHSMLRSRQAPAETSGAQRAIVTFSTCEQTLQSHSTALRYSRKSRSTSPVSNHACRRTCAHHAMMRGSSLAAQRHGERRLARRGNYEREPRGVTCAQASTE